MNLRYERLDINEFRQLHSETIQNFQCIEHDLKWIYSYMHKGDQYKNFEKLKKKTLGALVQMLKELDMSDGKPFVSASDYNFLNQMTKKRNYWCHQVYIDFVYEDDCTYSEAYYKVCAQLKKDCERLRIVSGNVEKVRLKAVKAFER